MTASVSPRAATGGRPSTTWRELRKRPSEGPGDDGPSRQWQGFSELFNAAQRLALDSAQSVLDRGAAAGFLVLEPSKIWSSENGPHHISCNIGQSEIAALAAEYQPFVIDAEQVQYGRMKVVHVHWLFGDVVAEFVGGSVGDPWRCVSESTTS